MITNWTEFIVILIGVLFIAKFIKWYWFDRYEGMIIAADNGDMVKLKKCLDRGMNINRIIGLHTALSASSSSGHLHIVKFLTENGADINKNTGGDNFTAIKWASISSGPIDKRLEVVKFLAEKTSKHEIIDLIATLVPLPGIALGDETFKDRKEVIKVLKSFISKDDFDKIKQWVVVKPKKVADFESKMIGKVITDVHYENFEESMSIGEKIVFDVDGSPIFQVIAGIQGYAIQFVYEDNDDSSEQRAPLPSASSFKKTWSDNLVISIFSLIPQRTSVWGQETYGTMEYISISGHLESSNKISRTIYFKIGTPDANFHHQQIKNSLMLLEAQGVEELYSSYEESFIKEN